MYRHLYLYQDQDASPVEWAFHLTTETFYNSKTYTRSVVILYFIIVRDTETVHCVVCT